MSDSSTPEPALVPRRSEGLLFADFNDGAVVYSPAAETATLLSPVAAAIIGLDEAMSVDDLSAALADDTGLSITAARARLQETVEELRSNGLVGGDVEIELRPESSPLLDAPAPGWVVGGTHAVHDHRIAFCGPDPRLVAAVDTLLGVPENAGEPTGFFGLEVGPTGEIVLTTSTEWRFTEERWLLWQLPGVINDYARFTSAMPLVHAGAVRTPSGEVVMVTGPVDAGKSTLIASLVSAGCDYLGDESIGIRPQTLAAVAHPKPLTIGSVSQRLVGLSPVGEPYTSDEHRRPRELRSDTVGLTGDVAPITGVLHVQYRDGAELAVELVDPNEAVGLLLANTLNLAQSGSVGLGALCALAESVPVLKVVHSDAMDLAGRIIADTADLSTLTQ